VLLTGRVLRDSYTGVRQYIITQDAAILYCRVRAPVGIPQKRNGGFEAQRASLAAIGYTLPGVQPILTKDALRT
jgi:hypothetical protein